MLDNILVRPTSIMQEQTHTWTKTKMEKRALLEKKIRRSNKYRRNVRRRCSSGSSERPERCQRSLPRKKDKNKKVYIDTLVYKTYVHVSHKTPSHKTENLTNEEMGNDTRGRREDRGRIRDLHARWTSYCFPLSTQTHKYMPRIVMRSEQGSEMPK